MDIIQEDSCVLGLSRQTILKANYSTLLAFIGESITDSSDIAVDSRVEWNLRLSDGDNDWEVCLYDYNDDLPIDRVAEWHVAARTPYAASLFVCEYLQFATSLLSAA